MFDVTRLYWAHPFLFRVVHVLRFKLGGLEGWLEDSGDMIVVNLSCSRLGGIAFMRVRVRVRVAFLMMKEYF